MMILQGDIALSYDYWSQGSGIQYYASKMIYSTPKLKDSNCLQAGKLQLN